MSIETPPPGAPSDPEGTKGDVPDFSDAEIETMEEAVDRLAANPDDNTPSAPQGKEPTT